MSDVQELTCGPARKGALWVLAGVGAVAVGLAVLRLVVHGPDPWLGVGLLFGLMGFVSFYASVSVVRADAYGVHTRTLLRRRSVPWRDIADLRVRRLWGGEYDDPRLVT
ncbi:MAG TPA: PH domain-containing protein, partial [Streptomyces sp.]